MNREVLMKRIIKRLSEECELRPSEVLVLLDYIKQLEEENFNLREGIYIEKMSFPSEGRNFKELMEMPTYQELQEENRMLKQVNKNTYESSQDMLGELSKENQQLHNKIDKAIELNGEIDKSLRMKNTSAYIELEDIIFEQWKMLKDGDVDE